MLSHNCWAYYIYIWFIYSRIIVDYVMWRDDNNVDGIRCSLCEEIIEFLNRVQLNYYSYFFIIITRYINSWPDTYCYYANRLYCLHIIEHIKACYWQIRT